MTERDLHIEFFGLNLLDPAVRLKFGGMYQSFFAALRRAGAKVTYAPKIPSGEPDVVITSPSWPREDLEVVAATTTAPVAFYVPPLDAWFDRAFLSHYRRRLLFAYGTARSERSERLYAEVGVPYHYLPLATDPEIMRPLSLDQEPLYDLVFAGGLSHRTEAEPFVRALLRDRESRQDLLLVTGGERFGVAEQTVTWGPILNLLYNLSRVGVNFHGAEQKQGAALRLDLNNRVFDLAAAGCCQVSDNVVAVRECFSEEEVPAFDDPEAWIEAALQYCRQPQQAAGFGERARQRVLREHTWDHRARTLLDWIQAALDRHEHAAVRIPPPRWLHARRQMAGKLRRVGLLRAGSSLS